MYFQSNFIEMRINENEWDPPKRSAAKKSEIVHNITTLSKSISWLAARSLQDFDSIQLKLN